MRPFSPQLSLQIDAAVLGRETSRGLRRLLWRIRILWLTRGLWR